MIAHRMGAVNPRRALCAQEPGELLDRLKHLALPPVEFLGLVKVDAMVDHDGCNLL